MEEFTGGQCFHLISRKTAQERGFKRFFTGKPCNHGHIAERYTSSKRCLACHRIYEIENKEVIIANSRKRHYKNRDEVNARRRAERLIPEIGDKLRQRDRERERAYDPVAAKEKREQNKEEILAYHRYYTKMRMRNDPDFRLNLLMRTYHRRILTLCNQGKDETTVDALGYTVQEYRENLEKNMLDGMSWDNHGDEWHIDHKIPVAAYIRSGVTDSAIINSLDNLIPMWKQDNINKKDKTLEEWLEKKGKGSREWDLYSRHL